jgi:hypothetical protein
MGVGGQRHAPAALPPERPGTHSIEWAPGPVWTGAENLSPTGIRSPDHPARSESQLTVTIRGLEAINVTTAFTVATFTLATKITIVGYQWSDNYYGYGNALKIFRLADMF